MIGSRYIEAGSGGQRPADPRRLCWRLSERQRRPLSQPSAGCIRFQPVFAAPFQQAIYGPKSPTKAQDLEESEKRCGVGGRCSRGWVLCMSLQRCTSVPTANSRLVSNLPDIHHLRQRRDAGKPACAGTAFARRCDLPRPVTRRLGPFHAQRNSRRHYSRSGYFFNRILPASAQVVARLLLPQDEQTRGKPLRRLAALTRAAPLLPHSDLWHCDTSLQHWLHL